MTLYLDTSLLVAALTNEPETERMQGWLGEQEPSRLAINDWVITEFSAALSMKLRTGQLEAAHRAAALAMFSQLSVNSFSILFISGLQFRTAARFADHHSLNLRAGDALHLLRGPWRNAVHAGPSSQRSRTSAGRENHSVVVGSGRATSRHGSRSMRCNGRLMDVIK